MTAITFDLTKTALTPAVTAMATLASSSTLLAGAQSAAVDLTAAGELQLEYMVELAVTGNTGSNMTVNTVMQLWSFFSEDGTNYEGGGEVTGAGQATKTLTAGGLSQGALIFEGLWNAATSQILRRTVPLLAGRPGRLTIPKKVVFWGVHNGGQALSAAAISVYPRNLL